MFTGCLDKRTFHIFPAIHGYLNSSLPCPAYNGNFFDDKSFRKSPIKKCLQKFVLSKQKSPITLIRATTQKTLLRTATRSRTNLFI